MPSTASMPGTSSAPSASSAAPRPPAAPEPGTPSRDLGRAPGRPTCSALPSSASRAAVRRAPYAAIQPSHAASTLSRSASERPTPKPFWGPNMRTAPRGPTSGLFTSDSATSRTPASAARAGAKSIASMSRTPQSPWTTCPPDASSTRAPSACSIPTPPSTVALPPRPTYTVSAPRDTASAISSPTPRVVAAHAAS